MPDLIAEEIVVEIPSDEIALGHDADGLPKTVLVERPGFQAKEELEEQEIKPSKEEADLLKALTDEKEQKAQMARERDEARQAREAAVADAEARIKTEREAREAAEAAAEKSTGIASNAHWATLHARKDQFEAGAANTRDFIAALKRDIAKASEDGEHAKIGDLQEQLAEAVSNRQTYESAKAAIEKEIDDTRRHFAAVKEQSKPEPKVAKEEKVAETVKPKSHDEWIGQFPRKTQAWLKANKDYVTDPAKHKQLTDFAAEWASDYGPATLHTPAFIEALNKQFVPENEEVAMADEDKTEKEVVVETKPAKAKAKVTASAPVSRSGNYFSSQNMNASAVKLPPKLAAFVKSSGLDATQYALGAVADIKAGKLPKDFLDPDYDHNF